MPTAKSVTSSANQFEKQQTGRTHSVARLFQIAFAFLSVFCPLVLVATLLCLFVSLPSWTISNQPEGDENLTVIPLKESVFLTAILSNQVTLTSSFASNIAQFAAAPFLLLFSYLVALELANRQQSSDQEITKLLQGDKNTLFSWTVHRFWRAEKTTGADGTVIAGVGALISLILT